MRPRVPGTLDVHALALLAHRPVDLTALAAEATRLIADGLSILDVAAALSLSTAAVHQLLNQDDKR